MNKDIIETISRKIQEITETADQERADLYKKLEDAQAAVTEAQKRMEAATASADTSAYHAAKHDEVVASTSVEMYINRLSQLNGKQLVSDEENSATVAAIRAEQKSLEISTTKKILARLKEIEDLGKAYYDQQNAFNELIVRWHQKVYKQPHRLGSRFEVNPYDLHYDDGELRSAIHNLVTNYFYRKKTGREQYHGTGYIWK